MYRLLSQGLRFIWPYQPQAAIVLPKTSALYSLSDEFMLRVSNIRSFAMPADFFERYPEFRGEAPQLEPSPIFYTPKDIDHIETLYWKLLRDKARRGEDEPAAPYSQQFNFVPSTTNRTTISRRSPPRLAIRKLLNPSSPIPDS